MPAGEAQTLASVRSFLDRQRIEFTETEEQHCTKLAVRAGASRATVSVYNTGSVVVGGKASGLKTLLGQMKAELQAGAALPGQALPFEIEKFPDTIRQRIRDCDPVIVRFVEEAIGCLRAGALLAAAFMVGAASERAINLLIQAYVDGIRDEANRQKLSSRIAGRMISKKFEEFTASYRGCKSLPRDPALSQDLDVLIGTMFQFCRITRNEIGHPQIVPDLDRGVLIANLGHVVTYLERVYQLIRHFRDNGVAV